MLPLTEDQQATRAHSLELEKQLAAIHATVKRRLGEERALGHDEMADSLQAALWHLGVSILQAVRLREHS